MPSTDGEPATTASIRRRRPSDNVNHASQKDDHTLSEKNDAALRDNAFSQHCEYFDLDSDGIIWPLDTFQVCRAWRWSFLTSLFFAGAIHFVQSYGSTPGMTPDPFWRIWKKNVQRNKHGSSTMSFEGNGALEISRLHSFFVKNDMDGKGGITFMELWHGLKMQALPLDLFGQVSNFFEWFFTYLLIWPKDGVLREDDAHAVCTGALFRSRAEDDAQHTRPQPSSSSLFARQALSLLVVNLIVLPAILAGMCYFVLRAIDDVVGLWKHLRRPSSAQESKFPEKSWKGYSDSSKVSEPTPPSGAGLAGLLVVVAFGKIVWSG